MKRLSCIAILLLTALNMMAFEMNAVPNGKGMYLSFHVRMQTGIVDPTYPNGQKPQSPVVTPLISHVGNCLYLERGCDNYLLELSTYDDGDVVFSTFITSSTDIIVLPDDLSGEYNITLKKGKLDFYGTIFI